MTRRPSTDLELVARAAARATAARRALDEAIVQATATCSYAEIGRAARLSKSRIHQITKGTQP